MTFAYPHFLWFLLAIPPAMALFFWWSWRARQKLMTQFIQARLLAALTVGVSPERQKIRFALVIFAVVFLIIALARPQHGFDLEEVEQRTVSVIQQTKQPQITDAAIMHDMIAHLRSREDRFAGVRI